MEEQDQTLMKQFNVNARRQLIPTGGMFELTPRCTLDCTMCYVHLTNEQMKGKQELSGDEWIRILDEAYAAGLVSLLLTGGECLLHKDFKKIYLHAKSLPIFLSVNTNGTLINEDYVDFFQKNPPRGIQITLYGNSEDCYEKVTGHRMFERVKTNILRLRDAGVNVHVAITPCKYLIDEVVDIVAFLKKEKIFYSVNPALCEANTGTGRTLEDFNISVEDEVEMHRKLHALNGSPFYQNEPITELPQLCEDDGSVPHRMPCAAGRSTFVVSWEGKMHPCVWLSEIEPDLSQVSFAEAWHICNEGALTHLVPVECHTCKYRPVCFDCTIVRMDPNNPGHCNQETCMRTIGKINAGIIKFENSDQD